MPHDAASVKTAENTNHHIHGKKNYMHVAIQIQALRRETKTVIERLFSRNKEFKALTEVK